jgi:hypothetical protein
MSKAGGKADCIDKFVNIERLPDVIRRTSSIVLLEYCVRFAIGKGEANERSGCSYSGPALHLSSSMRRRGTNANHHITNLISGGRRANSRPVTVVATSAIAQSSLCLIVNQIENLRRMRLKRSHMEFPEIEQDSIRFHPASKRRRRLWLCKLSKRESRWFLRISLLHPHHQILQTHLLHPKCRFHSIDLHWNAIAQILRI